MWALDAQVYWTLASDAAHSEGERDAEHRRNRNRLGFPGWVWFLLVLDSCGGQPLAAFFSQVAEKVCGRRHLRQ